MSNERYLIVSYFFFAVVCSGMGVLAYLILRRPFERIVEAIAEKRGALLKRACAGSFDDDGGGSGISRIQLQPEGLRKLPASHQQSVFSGRGQCETGARGSRLDRMHGSGMGSGGGNFPGYSSQKEVRSLGSFRCVPRWLLQEFPAFENHDGWGNRFLTAAPRILGYTITLARWLAFCGEWRRRGA